MNFNEKHSPVKRAQEHLDLAGEVYLKQINGIDSSHLAKYIEELERMKKHFSPNPTIVSVGIGNGIELLALMHHFQNKVNRGRVLGLDLSTAALKFAEQTMRKLGVSPELLQGSATSVPLRNESIDGYVLSAILHEIFSYVPDGENALRLAIVESLRVLKPEGRVYIKDFATTNDPDSPITLELKTDYAREFYKLFAKHYRKFESWGYDGVRDMAGNIQSTPNFPQTLNSDGTVTLSCGLASEFLMHLRNAFNDTLKGGLTLDEIGIRSWKEINEQYHPSIENKILSPNDYVCFIEDIFNLFPERKFEVIEKEVVSRPDNEKELGIHVGITHNPSNHTISDLTGKMFIVIKAE